MTCTEIAERLHRAIAYVSVRIQLTEDLHPDLIEKWRQNSSAPFFSEMRTLIRYPKNEQLREYNKVRSRRARIAAAKARKVAEGVVHVPVEDDGGNESNIRPRTLGLVNRRSASTCMTMINRHIPNSYLTPEEAKLAVGVVEWCLGMRHTLPFRVKRVRGDAKDERDFNQAHPVGSTPGDLGETVDDDAAE
jgi:hypothetical protein